MSIKKINFRKRYHEGEALSAKGMLASQEIRGCITNLKKALTEYSLKVLIVSIARPFKATKYFGVGLETNCSFTN